MEGFLLKLGTMSVQAAVIILVVCVIRLICIRVKVPQKYIVLLWMIPFFFMVFPWKISSPVGFWRAESVVLQYQHGMHMQSGEQTSLQEMVEQQVSSQTVVTLPESHKPATTLEQGDIEKLYSTEVLVTIGLFGLWCMGVVIIFSYMLFATLKLKQSLGCSICEQDNIYLAEDIS